MTITAAVTEAPGAPFTLQELELDEIQPDEVLVRIAAVGICHTDLMGQAGVLPTELPAVFGHEGAGVVEQVGAAVTTVAPGDHVALSFNSCGACDACRQGHAYTCHDFFARNFVATRPDGSTSLSRDGGAVHSHFFGQSSFATKAIASAHNVFRIPPELPFELAAPMGCGVRTGAGAVMTALRPQAGSSIAIFGTGGVGMPAIMAARVVGCTTIVAVDLKPARLELAGELGATHLVDAGREDAVEAINAITGHGADYTLEMSGSTVALQQAFEATASGGVCGVVGAPPFGTMLELDVNMLIARGRTMRGIVGGDCNPSVFFPRLVALWQDGRMPWDRLITTFPFDQINEAAESSERGDVIKAVLVLPDNVA
jgi:aryl-alcohol dehydrogenase